jgi:hypothetical protein
MRKLNRFVVMFTLVAMVFVGALGFVAAQDTTAPGTIQCDSDLILNLYVADRFFGFTRVRDQLATGGADVSTFVDLNAINKGQYTPWFDASMMGMIGAAGSTETGVSPTTGIGLNDQQLGTVSSTLMMDDASLQEMMNTTVTNMGVDTTTFTQLVPSAIAGEPAECSQLRTELNRFYNTVAFNDFSGAFATMNTGEVTGETGAVTGDMMTFSTALSGAAEVPNPGDPDGAGTADVNIDLANSQLCYSLAVQNLTLPAQAAHIHRAAAGEPGDVVVPFDLAPDASGSAAGCVAVDPALLTEISQNPAGFYVNVHTSDFPDGAVRGQVSG